MAQKRQSEMMNSLSTKMLKLTEDIDLEDDKNLDDFDLSEDVKMYFRYDSLLKTFVAGVEKIRMDEVENRWINFGQEEILNLINLLPIAEKIISRYTAKRSPKPIDIPFELFKGDVGDLITVLSVKENSYKRGKFDIDIRKCLTREDGTYTYTSEGVRFDHTLIEKFTNKVQLYQSMSETITKTTSNVMRISMAYAFIKGINEFGSSQHTCEGCQINHPSQAQHMGFRGCLSEDQPAWEEFVHHYWFSAKASIEEEDVLKSAKEAVLLLPEVKV